jgi:hypothetical protein
MEDSLGAFVGMTGQQILDLIASGVTEIWGLNLDAIVMSNPYRVSQLPNKPLVNRLFQLPGANASYIDSLKDFTNMFVVKQPGILDTRRQAFLSMARPLVARDVNYGICMLFFFFSFFLFFLFLFLFFPPLPY